MHTLPPTQEDTQSTNLERDIVQARDELKKHRSTDEYCKSRFPDFQAKLAAVNAKLQAVYVVKRAANPFKKQRESAQPLASERQEATSRSQSGLRGGETADC